MVEHIQYLRSPKLIETFKNFKSKYQELYPAYAWEIIEKEFMRSLWNEGTPDVLMQIYTELGLNAKGATFYKRHLKLLKELFPLDSNILEVGSGYIPAFANMIANEQLKLNKGTVTIYEPLLLEMNPKYPNMELHKEAFTLNTDISNYDLVLGILPCSVTETLIESACINKKDFYIAMCGCVHTSLDYLYGYQSTSPALYREMVIENTKRLVKQYDNGTLEITKLKNHPINFPILYNRR